MKCSSCGESLLPVYGDYPFHTKQLGVINIPNIIRYHCAKCDQSYLPAASSERVFRYVNDQIAKKLSALPIGDFISLAEAAEMLGVSKQAFTQNKRIERGFIYSHVLDGRQYYLRSSVHEFKNIGDGRIPIDSLSENQDVLSVAKQLLGSVSRGQWKTSGSLLVNFSALRTKSEKASEASGRNVLKYTSGEVRTYSVGNFH